MSKPEDQSSNPIRPLNDVIFLLTIFFILGSTESRMDSQVGWCADTEHHAVAAGAAHRGHGALARRGEHARHGAARGAGGDDRLRPPRLPARRRLQDRRTEHLQYARLDEEQRPVAEGPCRTNSYEHVRKCQYSNRQRNMRRAFVRPRRL